MYNQESGDHLIPSLQGIKPKAPLILKGLLSDDGHYNKNIYRAEKTKNSINKIIVSTNEKVP